MLASEDNNVGWKNILILANHLINFKEKLAVLDKVLHKKRAKPIASQVPQELGGRTGEILRKRAIERNQKVQFMHESISLADKR